jgi:hypothetical protein
LPERERDVQNEEDAAPIGLSEVRAWIKKYSSDTNALLRFVYGNTEPMEIASEGAKLDFSRARPVLTPKALEGRSLTKPERAKIADILSRMNEKYQAAAKRTAAIDIGAYDSTYFEEMPAEEEPMVGDLVLTSQKK